MSDDILKVLMSINTQLARMVDLMEKSQELKNIIISNGSGGVKPEGQEELGMEGKYKLNTELGKGDVPYKTCGKEVCRCLRTDGSCASHHPEFCPECIKLNS